MNYEDYMRSVLGYNQMPNNIYANTFDDYYYDTQYINNNRNNMNLEMLETMYPEIYKVVYPMIYKVCEQNNGRDITRELVDNMTNEVYTNIEPDDRINPSNSPRTVLKNGDVRNPNAKEPELRGETRQTNFMLRDLIKILILRELIGNNRPGPFPPRPPQPPRPGQRPPWRPY